MSRELRLHSFFGQRRSGNLFIKKCSYFVHMKPSCPSGYVPPAPLASPRAETPLGVSQLGLRPLLFPALQVVRSRGGGFGMHLVFVPGGFLPSCWISVQREGWECFWTIICCERARSRFANSFGSWRRVSCSFAAVFFLCPLHSSVDFHHSSPYVRQRGEWWRPSEDRYRVLSSRGFRSSDRVARVDKRALRERGRFSDRSHSRRVRSRLRGDRY